MPNYSEFLGRFFCLLFPIIPCGVLAEEATHMQCSIDEMLLRLNTPEKFSQIDPGDSNFTLTWTPAYISGEPPNRTYHAATIEIDLPFTPLVFYKYDLLLWGTQLVSENITPYFFQEGAKRHADAAKQKHTIEDSISDISVDGDYMSHKASIHLLKEGSYIFNYVATVRYPADEFRHDDIVITGKCIQH
jgi:hypothetical protein